VRIATKLATGLMGIGVLAVSYKLGNVPDTGMSLNAAPAPVVALPPATTGTIGLTDDGEDGTPSPAPTTAPSTPPKTTPKTPTPKKTTTPQPKPTTPPANNGGTTPTTPTLAGTKTGSLVQEPRWGGYGQVSVTKDATGKITSVNLIQAVATGGRQRAFSLLQSAAVSAQGSNFGNVGGATYTTDAFKQALDSALAKF
jgi:uncharacterized protein with FMN-binding domain